MIYRLYEKAAQKIESEGGTKLRVVLDYEMKRDLYRDLAKLKSLSPAEQEAKRSEIAQEHGLKVVNGKIPLPDLRIEYETATTSMRESTSNSPLGPRAAFVRKGQSRFFNLRVGSRCSPLARRSSRYTSHFGDSFTMKIQNEHTQAIKQFGYTDREARFVYVVAIHSGYFTQSQVRQFTGNQSGRTVRAFIKRALTQGHLKESKHQNNAPGLPTDL